MFTTCTHCQSRFRLNVAQLTAAHGHVRCGKCGEVFDAYEVLEGADVPPKMPAPEADTPQAEPEAPEAVFSPQGEAAPEIELSLPVEDEPITSAPALRATRKSKLPIDDLFGDLPDETPSEAEPMSSLPETDLTEPMGEVESISAEPAPSSYAHVDLLHSPPSPKPHRPLASAGLGAMIVLLLLLLGAQLVDLERAALSQNPVLGPSLKALYAALGHPINNASSVSDWSVGGLNVTTDPDSNGALSITGTLANHAAYLQPWPYLRVVLTDRFGETLRSRDFKPADYLAADQAASLLAPGVATHFRLDIVDPGPDAVGFSLTPCLDVPAGRVCAAASATD